MSDEDPVEQTPQEFEYRILKRTRYFYAENSYHVIKLNSCPGWTPWSEWQVFMTRRGNGRVYRSLSAARGVITTQAKRQGDAGWVRESEFRLQRRLVTPEWETIE